MKQTALDRLIERAILLERDEPLKATFDEFMEARTDKRALQYVTLTVPDFAATLFGHRIEIVTGPTTEHP
jgi:hypothetical protein